jgi:hypothetical protein
MSSSKAVEEEKTIEESGKKDKLFGEDEVCAAIIGPYLERVLDNPLYPLACGEAIYAAMFILEEQAKPSVIRHECHDLLTIYCKCLALMTPDSSDLLNRLLTCTCEKEDVVEKVLHLCMRKTKRKGFELLTDIYIKMADAVRLCLADCHPSDLNKTVERRLEKAAKMPVSSMPPWPVRTSDILPLGPEPMAKSFVEWIGHKGLPVGIPWVMTKVIDLCGQDLVEHMVSIPEFPFAVSAFCTMVAKSGELVYNGRNENVKVVAFNFCHVCCTMLQLLMMKLIQTPVSWSGAGTKDLITSVTKLKTLVDNPDFQSHGGLDIKAFQLAFGSFLYLLKIPSYSDGRAAISKAAALTNSTNKTRNNSLNTPKGAQSERDNPFAIVRPMLNEMATTHKCHNMRCLRTHETENRKFGKCGKCHFASYCSSKCQKGDWDSHKGACKYIPLVTKGKPPSSFFDSDDGDVWADERLRDGTDYDAAVLLVLHVTERQASLSRLKN